MTRSVLVLAAQGVASYDAERARELVGGTSYSSTLLKIERSSGAFRVFWQTLQTLQQADNDIVYLEGTGMRVGIPLLLASLRRGRRLIYVVSSGDAVDRYFRNKYGVLAGLIAGIYERWLYRRSSGFIGWTPYLVGRAIRMGAPTGLTIEGQVPSEMFPATPGDRADIRNRLGVANEDILVGVTGSLNWSKRQAYSYGLELVEAASRVRRTDISYVIVGGGTGRAKLVERARERGVNVRFIDRVPRAELSTIMSSLDLAVIAQTPDEVGLLRLTTKLPEYLAVGTPVVMPAVPGAFDYMPPGPESPVFILPALHPGRGEFWVALAKQFDKLDKDDLAKRRSTALIAAERFSSGNPSLKLQTLFDILPDTAGTNDR
ncbi:glycosyltransferase [Microbacterium sp. Gd 4-13]|uniref:glycosyltransferase n=1 Tax=Microbacterium sp. Gd 4-13 TaxID=2173179 RepID=UPI000D5708D3|nr:glycosyltransferase [Microbacterium sp. Gd 4-13]PVW02156.1 glycosyltransferase [Microbacterium sp. Gd 4-13]